MISNKNNSTLEEEVEEEEEQDNINPYDHEVHITTIIGPPAEKMINCLKIGQAFSFKDQSVEGIPILEVWAEVDKGFLVGLIIPFNFGKEIRKMSIDENEDQENENNNLEVPNLDKKVFVLEPRFHYEYKELRDNIVQVQVQFFIDKKRLSIFEKVLALKYHDYMRGFIEQAIFEKIENDLRSPETIATNFCNNLLKAWGSEPDPKPKHKSLQSTVND